MKISKRMMAIGVLVLAAVVVTGGIPVILEVLDRDAETDGVGYEYRDITGGSDENGGGDLLNAVAYVTSWTGGGKSELIAIQGHFRGDGWFEPTFQRYHYEITCYVDNDDIKINGVTGTTYSSQTYEVPDFSNNEWVPMEAIYITITNPCGGIVHVELWGHVADLNPLSADDGLLAEDEADLRSGVGKVQCVNDVVEEGSYAKIYVETGYAHSAISTVPDSLEGWQLIITRLETGTVYHTKSFNDLYIGTYSWLVPEGAYSSTSDNKFKVLLRNVLIDQDDDDMFVVGVGMLDDIPNKPTFEIVSGEAPFTPGESIKVKISATKTVYDIAKFWVSVSYETSAGTTTQYIIRDKEYLATQTTFGGYCTVEFTFPAAGNVRLEASAADTMNLNSGNSELTWTVYEKGDEPAGGLDSINWANVIIVVVLIVALIFIYAYVPIPEPVKWALVLVVLAVSAYFAMGIVR